MQWNHGDGILAVIEQEYYALTLSDHDLGAFGPTVVPFLRGTGRCMEGPEEKMYHKLMSCDNQR